MQIEKQKDMADNDRIGALPDDVLLHVLSFLPTKVSVSTGVLSKRWRFLWAHVPNLDFGSLAVLGLSNVIINGVIAKHKGHIIHTFRLRPRRDYGYTDSELERWTAFAIERNVQKVDLNLFTYYGPLPILPGCLFTCKTLVDLSLCLCRYIPMTSGVNLPRLKKLHLQLVVYKCDESLVHLLSGCPLLQELIVESDKYRNTRVKIDTPALRYLKLYDRVSLSLNVSTGHLPFLNEADICFVDEEETEADILHFHHLMEFVGRLYNVKTLKLSISTYWMKVSDSVFFNSNTVKFHNLRELQLGADWRFITMFLEIADNLKSITINIGHEILEHWMEPKHVPTCLMSHLGRVRINHFGFTEQAFNMVRYILGNAKVLKVMEIYFQNYSQKYTRRRRKARRIISLFERGSESCRLDFPLQGRIF